DDTGGGQRDVQETGDVELRQVAGPLGAIIELPGGIHPTNQSTHRRTRHSDDLYASLLEHLDHTDVRVTSGTSASEGERGSRTMLHHAIVEAPPPDPLIHLDRLGIEPLERRSPW